jgi:signal transduction histidine kinase
MNILLLKVQTFYRIYEQSRALNHMQKALREEIEFRKEAERKKDEFISIASHELKTPMTSIKGYIQLLERSLDKNDLDTVRTRLLKVQNQIEKLNLLVADLLDISKIESGKLKFNKQYFCFNEVLEHIMEVMQQSNPEVKIIKKGGVEGPVYGDEMRIEQVMVNFITNAIKYAPGTDEIHLHSEIRGDEVYFSVQDFGIGMSEEHQQKIFDKFYRIEETSERFQGLGIGLYICQEIIDRHEGRIGVHSTPGEGSEFYYYIPLNPAKEKINN